MAGSLVASPVGVSVVAGAQAVTIIDRTVKKAIVVISFFIFPLLYFQMNLNYEFSYSLRRESATPEPSASHAMRCRLIVSQYLIPNPF
jgi:hypothetical protein